MNSKLKQIQRLGLNIWMCKKIIIENWCDFAMFNKNNNHNNIVYIIYNNIRVIFFNEVRYVYVSLGSWPSFNQWRN